MDRDPNFRMTDIGAKSVTRRRALATGTIRLGATAFPRVRDGTLPKGDALRLAEMAGVLAAKRTAEIVPLCHPLNLDQVAVAFTLHETTQAVAAFCLVAATTRTGVEMEALAGVHGALLTIWDLVKPLEPALAIEGIRLLWKEGGKSGLWQHPDGLPTVPTAFLRTSQEADS